MSERRVVRRATRRWDDLRSFLEDWNGTLKSGAILFPAGSVEGELAPEVKLDLQLPIAGRVGPVTAQVVHRAPDGSTALQLPQLQAEAGAAIQQVFDAVEAVRDFLVASGELVPRSEIAELERRLAEAEARLLAGGGVTAGQEAAAEGMAPRPAPAARPAGRGFVVPDLSAQEPLHRGELGDRSLQDALVRVSVERLNGILTLKTADGKTRYGFWSKGGAVGFRTDPLQEGEVLGVLLYKAGQLTKEQLKESLVRMKDAGQRQGEALIDMGLMSFTQLIMVLGKQAEFVLQKVLAELVGSWTFHALPELPEQFLPPPIRVPSVLFRNLVEQSRQMPTERLAAAHRPNIDRYIHFEEQMLPVMADIRFEAAERKLVEVMRSNNWRMREVFGVSPLSRQVTAGVLWALVELGFLGFERQEDRERYLRRVTELIERKKRQLIKATHFEALEVHWISLPDEIQAAYERLIAEYDPTRFPDVPDELLKALQYIRQRLDQGFQAINNDTRRREYRKTIIEPVMIEQSAELLSKKGEMAIMRKDRRESSSCFAKALELVPGSADYKDGLQRARSLV